MPSNRVIGMNKPKSDQQEKDKDQRRRELYDEHKNQAWNDVQSSTKSFEQSLLAVSSGALGVSLAFVKDIVPLKQAICLNLLFASWVCFAACIILTVFSSPLSIAAQRKYVGYIWKFYMEGRQEYFDKRSWYSRALTISTWLAALLFLVGLTCTVVFCIKNVIGVRV